MSDSYKISGNVARDSTDHFTGIFKDFLTAGACWRISYLIGIGDIRKRYARSKLGQFWLTLSLAIHIASIGVIWSLLFKMSIVDYLPYFAVGHLFWVYISACITDGSTIYIASTSYLRELNIPKLSYINSLFIKNIIILLHNIPVIIITFLFCQQSVGVINILYSLCGLILTSIFLLGVTTILAIFSLRFRDLPNIIVSLINIAFYATPVMWRMDFLPVKLQSYMLFNPLAVFISLCRNPLLDLAIPDSYWVAALLYIIVSLMMSVFCFVKFHNRITYWL